MTLRRLNHAVLFVRDAERSAAFYGETLGFRKVFGGSQGLFLQAPGSSNDHDLGLFSVGEEAVASPAGGGAVGLYHLAWEVDSLEDLVAIRARLQAAGGHIGSSDHGTTKSIYGRDPDGLEFEVTWVIPPALLTATDLAARGSVRRLAMEAELARFGSTVGGGHGTAG